MSNIIKEPRASINKSTIDNIMQVMGLDQAQADKFWDYLQEPSLLFRDKAALRTRSGERGNVLFLILIAVALFAALSYAVTQSSRSGSDANRENTIISTSALTQYPNQIRTSVLRLVVGGNDPTVLQFNKPDEMTGSGYTAVVDTRAVFSPTGGAASYVQIPAGNTASGNAADWTFSMDFSIPTLGTDATDGTGNELIAFADDVTQSVCARVDQDLGYGSTVPVIASALTLANNRTATTAVPDVPSATVVMDDGGSPNWFKGRAFGCFQNGTNGHYVFFFTLAER